MIRTTLRSPSSDVARMTGSHRRQDAPQDVAGGCCGAAGRATLADIMPQPDTTVLYSIDTAGRLDPHVGQEWLLTNGLGGFSSSTVVGCNIRRYHGLLVAATLPPVGRVMLLNRKIGRA